MIIENLKFWYNNSRPYSIPITFLSWLVIFVYSLKQGGNFMYGILAYCGIALVHLATNLTDDYFDYKKLCQNELFLNSTKGIKCKYLKDGSATLGDLKNVIIILLITASIFGLILFFTSGWWVVIFALIGLFIAISYPKLSSKGFGDIAVIIAYGPLLFAGVYYCMTSTFSYDVLILSFACAMFVDAILYSHMLMDYDEDKIADKTTLCTILNSKMLALSGLMILYIMGYILIGIFSSQVGNKIYLITYLTMPMVCDLYFSLKQYNSDKTIVPKAYFWHYPLDNWENTKNSESAPFLFRFMYARNISTYFMLLMTIACLYVK